jgi:signal transduction histidine kinase
MTGFHKNLVAGAEQQRHEAEAVRRLYYGLDGVVQFMPLLPVLLVAGLWQHVAAPWLLTWMVIAMGIPLWRYVLVRRYRDQKPENAQARQWGRLMTWTALIDGLIWGVAGMLFYVPNALPPQLILLTFIIGIPAGSIFTTSWWPATLYAFSLPALGLTTIELIRHATPGHVGLAIGLIIYIVILAQIIRQAHSAAMETIALRFENLELIQQLREEKQIAEQANRAKSQFLAAASHDLRQPLHALGLFVETLSERIRYPEARMLMDNINRSVAALEDLFDALLDISRLDAGIVDAVPRHTALGPLLKRLDAEFATEARAKRLGWHVSMTDVVAVTDPALLERVLRNLLSNAIRYTKQGEVRLNCSVENEAVLIEVADTGSGILPEHQQDVFREFFQLHNPERDRNKGLGLGLSIVHRLTQLLGHPLELQSQPGKGTVFRLRLPRGDSQAVVADETDLNKAIEDTPHALVLVIDDEAAVRESMKLLLEGWGYTVVVAASGDEALHLLDCAPAAIIADYRLRDEETGDNAIRQIQTEWGNDIAALIVTGDTDPERLRMAQQSGFAFLHKPVPPGKLRAFLRTGINRDS